MFTNCKLMIVNSLTCVIVMQVYERKETLKIWKDPEIYNN